MKMMLGTMMILAVFTAVANTPPEITNVRASQRTDMQLVETTARHRDYSQRSSVSLPKRASRSCRLDQSVPVSTGACFPRMPRIT